MKYLRIIILVVAIFAVGAFLLQADLSSLLPSQAKPAASTSKPTLTKVQTPTRTPTRTREVPLTPTNTPTINPTQNASSFMFASAGDAQDEEANFPNTTNAIASLHPNFLIFNGDLESNGVNSYEMNRMVAGLKSAGIFNQTFLVRGNHDNKLSGSASAWENYFSTSPNIKTLPAGVGNYVALDLNSTYLTYSFDYGNSRFIGADAPGDAHLSSAEFTFIDQRLTDAESLGLVHPFIYFHGPEYCIESTHCSCTTKNDSSCTQAKFINLINKHPIVSATFHGHEHILGWVHMDSTRISGLTHPYEEFFTSPSGGGSYNQFLYSARVDYYYPNMPDYYNTGFGTIAVNGNSFTVNFYKVGTTAPVWNKTFTK